MNSRMHARVSAAMALLLLTGCQTLKQTNHYLGVSTLGFVLITGKIEEKGMLSWREYHVWQKVGEKSKKAGRLQIGGSMGGTSVYDLNTGASYELLVAAPPGRTVFYLGGPSYPFGVDVFEGMTSRVVVALQNSGSRPLLEVDSPSSSEPTSLALHTVMRRYSGFTVIVNSFSPDLIAQTLSVLEQTAANLALSAGDKRAEFKKLVAEKQSAGILPSEVGIEWSFSHSK